MTRLHIPNALLIFGGIGLLALALMQLFLKITEAPIMGKRINRGSDKYFEEREREREDPERSDLTITMDGIEVREDPDAAAMRDLVPKRWSRFRRRS